MNNIFEILRWVYLSELTKVVGGEVDLGFGGGGWGAIDEYARLGTLIDAGGLNQFGVLHDKYAGDTPHPDALMLGTLLKKFNDATFQPFYSECPLRDLVTLGLESEEVLESALARMFNLAGEYNGNLHEFIVRAVILGRLPEFVSPKITKQIVKRSGNPAWFIKTPMAIHGKTFEVEEFSVMGKGNRPAKGAYQKHEWLPSPCSILISRLEYALFHSVLSLLEDELREFNPARVFAPLKKDNRVIEFNIFLPR